MHRGKSFSLEDFFSPCYRSKIDIVFQLNNTLQDARIETDRFDPRGHL